MADEFLTEAILESTRDLDQRSVGEILDAIHAEDHRAVEAVGQVLPDVERAVEILVLILKCGGCWFNVGAGTSGRIGVLDAAEIPPTNPANAAPIVKASSLYFCKLIPVACAAIASSLIASHARPVLESCRR